jgi:uncharacterized protein YneF (UPF0154 family)
MSSILFILIFLFCGGAALLIGFLFLIKIMQRFVPNPPTQRAADATITNLELL